MSVILRESITDMRLIRLALPYPETLLSESITYDLQFGISQRLQHAPIRFAATMQHLQKWNLAQAEEDNTNGTTVYTEDGFAKKFMRHLVLGVELLPSCLLY